MKQANNILNRFNSWAKANPEVLPAESYYRPFNIPLASLFNRLKRFFSSK